MTDLLLEKSLEVVIKHEAVPGLLALPGLARPHDPLDPGDGGRARGEAEPEQDTGHEDSSLKIIMTTSQNQSMSM